MNMQLFNTYMTVGACLFKVCHLMGPPYLLSEKKYTIFGSGKGSPPAPFPPVSLILVGKMQEELNVAKAGATLLPIKRSSLKQSVVASTFLLVIR